MMDRPAQHKYSKARKKRVDIKELAKTLKWSIPELASSIISLGLKN